MTTYITIYDESNVVHYMSNKSKKQFNGTFKEWLQQNMPLYKWIRMEGNENMNRGFVKYIAKNVGGKSDHYFIADYTVEDWE